MKRSPWLVVAIVMVLCVLGLGRATRAEPLAQLVPADTGVFLEVSGLRELMTSTQDDPLATQVRTWLGGKRPMAWRMLEGVLEMDGRQILETYFGQQVGLVLPRPGDKAAVIISRVEPADSTRLVGQLELQPMSEVGPFRVYQTGDAKALMAINGSWLLMTGTEHSDYFKQVLEGFGKGATLSQDAGYQAWTAKLPAQRLATLYVRDAQQDATHAMSLTHSAAGVSLQYAGRAPDMAALVGLTAAEATAQFGPLPASTLLAANLNVWKFNAQSMEFMDRLIAPQRFQVDLLPHLQPPWLAFVGHTATAAAPGSAPVLGLAVKVSSAQGSDLLNRAFNNLVLLGNVATMQWGTPPLVAQVQTQGQDTFTVVDLGPMLTQRMGRSEMAAVRMTFGAVGEWFMVCTNDSYFREALAARQPGAARFASGPAVSAMPAPQGTPPLASVVTDPKALSQKAGQWLDYADQQRQAAGLPMDADGVKLMTAMGMMQQVMPHFQSLWARLHVEDDGVVVGRVELVRAR